MTFTMTSGAEQRRKSSASQTRSSDATSPPQGVASPTTKGLICPTHTGVTAQRGEVSNRKGSRPTHTGVTAQRGEVSNQKRFRPTHTGVTALCRVISKKSSTSQIRNSSGHRIFKLKHLMVLAVLSLVDVVRGMDGYSFNSLTSLPPSSGKGAGSSVRSPAGYSTTSSISSWSSGTSSVGAGGCIVPEPAGKEQSSVGDSDLNFSLGEALKKVAKARGWVDPNEELIKEQKLLRNPTFDQIHRGKAIRQRSWLCAGTCGKTFMSGLRARPGWKCRECARNARKAAIAVAIASAAAQVAIETCSLDDFKDFWASVGSESTAGAHPAPAAESIDFHAVAEKATAKWQAQLEVAEAAPGSDNAPSVGSVGSTVSGPATVAAVGDVASTAASEALTSLPCGSSAQTIAETVAQATADAVYGMFGSPSSPGNPGLNRQTSIKDTNPGLARRITDRFRQCWRAKVGKRAATVDTCFTGLSVLQDVEPRREGRGIHTRKKRHRRRLNTLEVIFADILKDLPPRKK